MDWRFKSALVIGVVVAPIHADPAPTITVFVYNYAGADSKTVTQMHAEAARIFRHAGIETRWLDCSLASTGSQGCGVSPGPTRLSLRVLPPSMARRYPSVQDSFGFALQPEDGSFGTTANVFADNAAQLAHRRGMSEGALLGHLAAHELGHLLLGVGGHAPTGIMHVPWHVPELTLIAKGQMLFTPQEGERMRINARRLADIPNSAIAFGPSAAHTAHM